MEQIFNDSLGNTVTVKYDATLNLVTVNNSGVDSSYHEVIKCNDNEPHVICIDTVLDWENWSDVETRYKVGEFFWENKVL